MSQTATRSADGFRNATVWSYVMNSGQQVLSLVVTFVLAAVLGPAVFGLAAMATVYVMLIELIQRQGMVAALIQRKELSDAHKNSAFWLVMASSLVLTGLAVAGAGWWAGVNDTPELRNVIIALSPLLVLQGLTAVQTALLMRKMDFKALATRTIASGLVGGMVGVLGALSGLGVYALVAQQLTFSAVAVVVLWSISDWRPRLTFSISATKDLLAFSTGALLTSVAVFVNNQADALLIGVFFGPLVVGIYRLGSRLIDVLLTALVGPIQSLALPEMAPHQDNLPELTTRLRRLLRMAAVAAFPALGVLAAGAEPLTRVLGPRWTDASAVIQVLCVVGVIRVILTLDGPLLQAVGSPMVQAGITWFAAAVSATTFSLAGVVLAGVTINAQALGVATARAGVYGLVICALHVWLLRRYGGLSLREGLRPFLRPLLAGVAAASTGWLIQAMIPPLAAPLRFVVVVGGAGAAGLLATWWWVPGCAGLMKSMVTRRPLHPVS